MSDTKFMKFSENLKKIIHDRGIKITTISEETGIPMSTLSEWTAGREPKVSEALVKLSRYLNVSLDDLILGDRPVAGMSLVCESILKIEGRTFCLKIFDPFGPGSIRLGLSANPKQL